jgi:phosphoribosylanthranilate isomerase
MLKTNIKASSIKNLSDARYFAAKDVESLGFCLDEGNENYIAPHLVKAMKAWIEGPTIIGEFGLQSTEEILESIRALELDAVQLNLFSAVDRLRLGVSVIQEIVVEESANYATLIPTLARLEEGTSLFLIDLEKNNLTWQKVIASPLLEVLQRLCQKYKILLSISCSPAEISSILKIIQPYGLSLKGGEEERVGVKSFDELEDIFEVLEEE